MKKRMTLFLTLLLSLFTLSVNAQDKGSSWSTGLDIYSSYVWRGTRFGSGPSMQPSVEFSTGGFALGAWGSYSFSADRIEGTTLTHYMEADLYADYGFDLGDNNSLTLTVTDYYFPESSWFDGNSHFFEPMVGLGLGNFSISGAYMMGNGVKDTYIEAGLSVGSVNLTLGAGDNQYTSDGKFNVCNIGISTSKEAKVTDTFSLPVTGSVILNPSTKILHIVVGISL